MTELVSVIIPVYNMAEKIEASVESILSQDYANIEIILVDDGSKDQSFEKCILIADKDSRVKVIHIENQGSGPARNVGVKESKGCYLYFPDADDYLERWAISTLVKAMENKTYDLIVFGYRRLSQDQKVLLEKKYKDFTNTGENIRQDYTDYFGMSSPFSIQGAPWNKFFDGSVVRNNSIEFPPLRRHQDEAFICRYVSYCKNVKFISDVLYTYIENTLQIEWNKFPVNYIDSVIGLYKIRKETVCKWNPNNIQVLKAVDIEYFERTLKALELSFSPKMKLNYFSRSNWLKLACKKTKFDDSRFLIARSWYQKAVLFAVKGHLYLLAECFLFVGNIKNAIRLRGRK